MTGHGIRAGWVIPGDRILVGPHDDDGVATGPQEAVTVDHVRMFAGPDSVPAPFPAMAIDYHGDGTTAGCLLFRDPRTPVMLLPGGRGPLPYGMAA